MTKERLLKNLLPPAGPVDVVLDTDAYNEVDDQFAIAYLVRSSDRLTVKAFCAAPFFNAIVSSPAEGMEKSYDEIFHILSLSGRDDLHALIHRGSDRYLPDEQTPVDSDAARFLIELSRSYSADHPLYVVTIGAITNVASALLLDPTMAERTVVVWLGGHAHHWVNTREFNMMQDVAAARVVFDSGVPLVQLPCRGVVDRFSTTQWELEHWLGGKSALCDYLIAHTADYACRRLDLNGPWSKPLWDVTAIGWLLNDNNRFMEQDIRPCPIPEYDNHYSFDADRYPMAYVRSINRDALYRDLFEKLAKK